MIEIGEYIKTDSNLIARVIGFYNDQSYELDIEFENEYVIYDYNVLTHSKDILDLIECQDLMYIDISPDNCGGIVVPRVAETLAELDSFKEKIRNREYSLMGIISGKKILEEAYTSWKKPFNIL